MSEPIRHRLTKQDRIRRSSEFQRVMKYGTRHRTAHFSIRMLANSLGTTRLGISTGKKTGKACSRNLIRRRLREYFRLNREQMPPETDIVFIALPGAAALVHRSLGEELDRFFSKARSSAANTPSQR